MAAAAGTRVPLPEPKSTPLGPATNKLNQPKKVDTALLRPALTTTVTGMRQAIHALETGTLEVRSYLLNEVNLIYECKVCHNMFRSLVNLIAHKRSFCKQQYKQVTHVYDDPDNTKAAELETVIIEAEAVETVIPPDEWEIENYAPSLDLLKDAGIIQDIQSRPLINRLLPPKKQGLSAVVASLRAKVGNKDAGYYENQCRQIEARKSVAEAGTLYIEPISETSNGLFQTWKVTEGEAPTTGENYRVIQEKEKAISVTLSENGTAMPRGVPAELEAWKNGPVSPGSEGSKENHEDRQQTTKFQCPECKKLFTLVKTVIKHLVKFHNKTMDQAKLLRKKIKNGAITVKDTTPKKPRDEWYSHCTKCWTKFKTKAEEKLHHDSKTCKWRQSRPDDPYYEEFKGLPSHINRINAYVRVKNKKCSSFISGSRKGNGQASLDFLSGLLRGKVHSGDSTVNDLEEQSDDISDFGSRRISISSSSTDDIKSLDQMVVDREMVPEREELLPLKIESEMNRRNLMNKRKIKCNVCYDMKFKSTYLLKRHVATEHMELARWKCTICDFRIWSRDECLRHATDNHRLRGNDNGIAERSIDEYFKEYLDRREAEERVETENKVEQDFMMMEDGSMVVGETSARNSFENESSARNSLENCNGDDDGEVSFTVKDISTGGEPRKRKRSSSEESVTASENSNAKQSRSGTNSPISDEAPTTPSKILPGKVMSSFMDDLSHGIAASQSHVPNLDESHKEDQKESMSPLTVSESRSSDLNGSPQKSNGL